MLKYVKCLSSIVISGIALLNLASGSTAGDVKLTFLDLRKLTISEIPLGEMFFKPSPDLKRSTVFRVSFSTNLNLRLLANQMQMRIFPKVDVCDSKRELDSPQLADTVNDEFGILNTDPLSAVDKNILYKNNNYWIYFSSIQLVSPDPTKVANELIDLVRIPQSVCIVLIGEDRDDQIWSSKELRLSSRQIQNATRYND
jgi:hypothetical protein